MNGTAIAIGAQSGSNPVEGHSPVELTLPHGVVAHASGLRIPEGMTAEQWLELGRGLIGVIRSSMFWWGDWLAYGQSTYADGNGRPRLEDGTLDRVAEMTGFSRSTLANAKMVCLQVEISRRRENVTFNHLLEIVAKAPPSEIDQWQERVEEERLSVAALRETLRRQYARRTDPVVPPDPTAAVMTKVCDFVRWWKAECPGWHPIFRKRVAREMEEVQRELGRWI